MLPAAAPPVTGPLQGLRPTRARSLASALLCEGHAQCVQMAQSTRGEAGAFYLGAVHAGPRSNQDSTATYHGGQTTEGVRMRTLLCTADARTPEAPDAGKLHVRDCTGGPGNRHSYRRGVEDTSTRGA